jgi:hypothetical protein
MDNDLGEFVGRGFAMLRDRLKAVEARQPLDGIDGDDGKDGIDGKDAVVDYDKIRGMIPDPVPGKDAVVDYALIKEMIPDPVPGKDAVVDYDKIRRMIPDPIAGKDGVVDYDNIKAMIPPPIPGKDGKDGIDGEDGTNGASVKGEDGNGVSAAKIDARGHLIITLDDGTQIDAGKAKGRDGVSYQGLLSSVTNGSGAGSAAASGIAEIDFGGSAKTATVVVTGIASITATSVVICKMRIEDTDDHTAEDMLVDPIRVEGFAIVPGVGFTIYGAMENAPANGKYNVQWTL